MVFSDETIQAVWEKARGMQDRDAAEWRMDSCGAWLHRQAYNNVDSEFGWKIEKISPGGPDTPENLEPFQWKNAFDIANSKPHCRVTADRAGMSPTQRLGEPHNAGL